MWSLILLCGFSFFLNVSGDHIYVTKSIRRGEEIIVESTGYPAPIPPNTIMSWKIQSEDGDNMKLFCHDIRMFDKPNGCGDDKLIVDNGSEEKEICGVIYDYETITTGPLIKIQLFTGNYMSGGVACAVTVVEPPTQAPPPYVPPTQRPIPTTESNVEVKDEEPHSVTTLRLVPGGTSETIKSPKHPEQIPRNTNVAWHLETEPGSTIRISCREIRLRGSPEKCYDSEFFKITDGENVKKLCGGLYDFSQLSSGNKVTVQLVSTTGGGGVSCTAQGRVMDWYGEVTTKAYYEVSSEELDSSEFGGPPGRKTTNCKCGWSNKAQKRIVNGVEAGINEFPYMVGIFERKSGFNFCGGSIVTRRHILTAAHCLWRYEESGVPLSVSVGDHDLSRDDETKATQIINVERTISHPDFHKVWLYNDVALLVLEKDIEFNQYVGPVCLPPQGWFDLKGEYITVTGWGLLEWGGEVPDRLQKLHVRAIDLEECAKAFNHLSAENKTNICTYGNKKATCKGDSGGPVVWVDPDTNRYTQVGIVSFGRVCADTNPSGHTSVAAYADWIKRHIQETIPLETCSKVQ